MSYEPYVPSDRLAIILTAYMDRWGINKSELCRELASATGKTVECWERRIYSILRQESKTVRFQTADEILTNLYLVEHWITDLADIYERAA